MKRDIGLALSGGGFRAVAFHLGCLRALNDLGLLERIQVISGVSGGALLTALYAYGPLDFASFDAITTRLLYDGLHLAIVRRALLSQRAAQAALGLASLPVAGALALIRHLVRRTSSTGLVRFAPSGHTWMRHINRTTALADVLSHRAFGATTMPQVRHPGLDVVLSACDLGTGGAVRFGSRVSACSRLGTILDDVPVATAVAASAAYPVLLPALEQRYRLRDRSGAEVERVLLLTDGGVYDNLGLSVLARDRDADYTPHVYDVDYVVACDAGQGQPGPAAPRIWPTRMLRVVGIMHARAQQGERSRLFSARDADQLRGFAYAYLGMRDDRLPVQVPDLVPREIVVRYPTDFRAMVARELDSLATRGEQLVRTLLPHYCPSLV